MRSFLCTHILSSQLSVVKPYSILDFEVLFELQFRSYFIRFYLTYGSFL
jgi:hypothetical protein